MGVIGRLGRRSGWLALPALLASCALGTDADEGYQHEDDGPLAASSQAFTGVVQYTWGVTSTSSIALEPATSSGWTCFLTGVDGNLAGNIVKVYEAIGGWRLAIIINDPGEMLRGHAACINTTANRTTEVGAFVDTKTWVANGTAKRRCFLTQVKGNFGDAFENVDDLARVYRDATLDKWYLHGKGDGAAYARCVDVNASFGNHTLITGDNDLSVGIVDALPGRQCFLTALGGAYDHQSWSNGGRVEILGDWALTAWPHKRVSANCVQ
jgi:hypothetical protein